MKGFLKSDGWIYQLSPKITTIGRNGCDVIIDNESLDSQHASIEYFQKNRIYALKDLNTHSGIFVNDILIKNEVIQLKNGDKIRFGNSQITYEFFTNNTNEDSYEIDSQHIFNISRPSVLSHSYPERISTLNRQIETNEQTKIQTNILPTWIKIPKIISPELKSLELNLRKSFSDTTNEANHEPIESDFSKPNNTVHSAWSQSWITNKQLQEIPYYQRKCQQVDVEKTYYSDKRNYRENIPEDKNMRQSTENKQDHNFSQVYVCPRPNPASQHYLYTQDPPPHRSPYCFVQMQSTTPGRLELFDEKKEESAKEDEDKQQFINYHPVSVVDGTPKPSARQATSNGDISFSLEKYKTECRDLNTMVEYLRYESACKDTKISLLSQENDNLQSQLSEKVASYKILESKLNLTLNQMNAIVEKAASQQAFEMDIESLKVNCSNTEATCRRLQETLKLRSQELKAANSEIECLTENQQKAEGKVKELTIRLAKAEESEAALKSRVNEAASESKNELDNLRCQITNVIKTSSEVINDNKNCDESDEDDTNSLTTLMQEAENLDDAGIVEVLRNIIVTGSKAKQLIKRERQNTAKSDKDLHNEIKSWIPELTPVITNQNCSTQWRSTQNLEWCLQTIQQKDISKRAECFFGPIQSLLVINLESQLMERKKLEEAFGFAFANLKAFKNKDSPIQLPDVSEDAIEMVNSLSTFIAQMLNEYSDLAAKMQETKTSHQTDIRKLREKLEGQTSQRISEAITQSQSGYDAKLQICLEETKQVEEKRRDQALHVKEAIIMQLEQTITELNDKLKSREEEFDKTTTAMSNQLAALAVNLQKHTDDLKAVQIEQAKSAEMALAEQTAFEVTCEAKWKQEVDGHREQVRQHARTICVMEERLAQFAKEVTDTKSENLKLQSLLQKAGPASPNPENNGIKQLLVKHQQLSGHNSRNESHSAIPVVEDSLTVQGSIEGLREKVCTLNRLREEQDKEVQQLQKELLAANARTSDAVSAISERQKQEMDATLSQNNELKNQLVQYQLRVSKLDSDVKELKQKLVERDQDLLKANATVRVARDTLSEETDKCQLLRSRILDESKASKQSKAPHTAGCFKGKVINDEAALGAICRAQRHEQIITQQKLALAELRTRLHNLFTNGVQGTTEKEALEAVEEAYRKEALNLRRQVNELKAQLRLKEVQQESSFLNLRSPQSQSRNLLSRTLHNGTTQSALIDAMGALHMAEDCYAELVMAIERLLCIEAWPIRRSMVNLDAIERQKLREERQKFCSAVTQKLSTLCCLIKHNAELIRDYKSDLERFKSIESTVNARSDQCEENARQLRVKKTELGALRETLIQTKEALAAERYISQAVSPKMVKRNATSGVSRPQTASSVKSFSIKVANGH